MALVFPIGERVTAPMLAPSSGGRGRVYRLTVCKKEQQGVFLADEGLRGQQEGGRESRRFLFGDSYGTCVGKPGYIFRS